jgi:hypothetical protein
MSESSKNTKDANELKYEGLAALIVEGQEHAKQRHEEFVTFIDFRFKGLEEHNKRQNGSIGKAMEDISELQKESNERKLTCMTAVEVLQKKTRYASILKWVDDHPKRSTLIFFILVVGLQSLVLRAHEQGWLGKLWEFIVKVVT